MYGVLPVAKPMAVPSGLNATPLDEPGKVAGLEYLDPKPDADQGYTSIPVTVLETTAISVALGLKATPLHTFVGKVDGSAYFVPNPLDDHG